MSADIDIGKRLKELRNSKRLSQRQLAARTGVTNGLISMIEQNKISPSIASLKKILDGFSIGLADFFSDSSEPEPKTFFRWNELPSIRPPAVHGPDAPQSKLTLLRLGQPGSHNLMMLHETYEPGADTGPTLYSHESEECGLVLSGQIEITVGEEVSVLGPGDGYIFNSQRPHRFRNTGLLPCILVSACTPPTF